MYGGALSLPFPGAMTLEAEAAKDSSPRSCVTAHADTDATQSTQDKQQSTDHVGQEPGPEHMLEEAGIGQSSNLAAVQDAEEITRAKSNTTNGRSEIQPLHDRVITLHVHGRTLTTAGRDVEKQESHSSPNGNEIHTEQPDVEHVAGEFA